MAERESRTYVHYGFLADNASAPVINNYISVENDSKTTCFDAVIFPVENVIIVDCSVKLANKTAEGYSYTN